MRISQQVYHLTLTSSVPRWRFPLRPFTAFTEADEQIALALGWSPWGGEAYDTQETVTVPRVYFRNIEGNVLTFHALMENAPPPA